MSKLLFFLGGLLVGAALVIGGIYLWAMQEASKTEIVFSEPAYNPDNPCAFRDERLISFKSWNAQETAKLEVQGESCRDSHVLLEISDTDGKNILTGSASLDWFSSRKAQDEVLYPSANSVYNKISPARWKRLLLPEESVAAAQGWEIYDAALYQYVQRNQPPLVCMPRGSEGIACLVYDEKVGEASPLVEFPKSDAVFVGEVQ